MPLTLRWNGSTRLPVEGASLRPDELGSLAAAEVPRHRLPVGNGTAELGELFAIEGDAGDGRLVLEGDLRNVCRIGQGMASGTIAVRGDVGPGLGRGMSGGEIVVEGAAGDSAGAAMRGGMIRITGSAGDNLGGSDPGARVGMRDGLILVIGPIGRDAGLAMRRGIIAVTGAAGDGLGRGMIAGSIFAFGNVGESPGSGDEARHDRPLRPLVASPAADLHAERTGPPAVPDAVPPPSPRPGLPRPWRTLSPGSWRDTMAIGPSEGRGRSSSGPDRESLLGSGAEPNS